MEYTFDDYSDMHLIYGEARCNALRAQRIYANRFPNRQLPNSKTLQRIDQRLRETGSFKYGPTWGSSERFLSTGDSYHSLMYLFKISKQAISKIVVEVCDALTDVLQDYIKMPKNKAEWKAVAEDSHNQTNNGRIKWTEIREISINPKNSNVFNIRYDFNEPVIQLDLCKTKKRGRPSMNEERVPVADNFSPEDED